MTITKRTFPNTVLLFALCCLLCSCTKEKQYTATRAVYHWKTVFNPDAEEVKWLKDNNISKLYLRMFDVDWNNDLKEPLPVGDVQIKSDFNVTEIVPVVFITNRTFINVPDSAIDILAVRISDKIKAKMGNFSSDRFNEIQLDCDWSEKTRDRYFHLIKLVKLYSKCGIISATIRLHQIKYFTRTGVPPVDRGMLMFYNMGSIDNIMVKNSIYDTETAKKYLYNFDKYPLKLDLVLPAFSWGSLYRKGKLLNLINEVSEEELRQSGSFTELNTNRFLCKSSTTVNGIRCMGNDLIKLETITPELTESAARLISEYIKKDNLTIALYHLNKEVIRKYEKAKLQNIYSKFN